MELTDISTTTTPREDERVVFSKGTYSALFHKRVFNNTGKASLTCNWDQSLQDSNDSYPLPLHLTPLQVCRVGWREAGGYNLAVSGTGERKDTLTSFVLLTTPTGSAKPVKIFQSPPAGSVVKTHTLLFLCHIRRKG